MTDTQQSAQERDKLHSAIWKIANDLRGAVDGWDFKNYVLGTMFYRYLSEYLANDINENERKFDPAFSYENLSNEEAQDWRKSSIDRLGFFLLPHELFCNVTKNAQRNDNLNFDLQTIFGNLEQSTKAGTAKAQFEDLFKDFDPNSNKLGAEPSHRVQKLRDLLSGIAQMDLGDVKDHKIDAFGDAYEFLMTMYASNAGKSGGEFFTPAYVSNLLTRLGTIGKKSVNKVYDPACGSGSLLLQAAKVLGKENVELGFFGQEINVTTYNLCRINMILHGVPFNHFNIAREDTLIEPKHDKFVPFELIVSNPPYSIKWKGKDEIRIANDRRFTVAGAFAPKNNADLAFVLHALSYLSPQGRAVILCFPGVMYRGGAEKTIRQYLVEKANAVDAVIHLADNLFFGTSIAVDILILNKGKKDNSTIFIDASAEFVKDGNQNQLSAANIARIVETYEKRENVPHFAAVVPLQKIIENDFNLSVSAYVETRDTREKTNIVELNAEIAECVAAQNILRQQVDSWLLKLSAA